MLSKFNSDKFKFWSFISMTVLVFVHGYNLDVRYMEPWTTLSETLNVTSFTEYFLANGIFRFRIPMLFVISGYLYALHDQRPNKERIKKRASTLVLPYLLWSGLYMLIFYGFELWPVARTWVAASHVVQIDREGKRLLMHDYHWYEVLARWILFPLPYQFWFIRSLFVYNLAYPLLKRWVTGPTSIKVFFSIAFLLWLATAPFFFFEGEGLLFFSLGVWMQKASFDIDKPARWLNPMWWGLVFVVIAAFKTWLAFKGAAILGNAVYPILAILHKLVIASGLITAWFGCNAIVKWSMNKAWFVWLTAFSFMIYAVHAPLVAIAINPFFDLLGRGPGYQMLTFIFLPLTIIVFAIGLGALLRKVAPTVYSVLTGGRGL